MKTLQEALEKIGDLVSTQQVCIVNLTKIVYGLEHRIEELEDKINKNKTPKK